LAYNRLVPKKEKNMKNDKKLKKTKLTKKQVKAGIFVSKPLGSREVPWRKLNLEVMHEVQLARRSIVVTNYGKPMAIILPLAQ
jgi:hypothetical protein